MTSLSPQIQAAVETPRRGCEGISAVLQRSTSSENRFTNALLDLQRLSMEHNIPNAIAGGLAAIRYGYPAAPQDIDVEIEKDKLTELILRALQYGFTVAWESKTGWHTLISRSMSFQKVGGPKVLRGQPSPAHLEWASRKGSNTPESKVGSNSKLASTGKKTELLSLRRLRKWTQQRSNVSKITWQMFTHSTTVNLKYCEPNRNKKASKSIVAASVFSTATRLVRLILNISTFAGADGLLVGRGSLYRMDIFTDCGTNMHKVCTDGVNRLRIA